MRLDERLNKYGWAVHSLRYHDGKVVELMADKVVDGKKLLCLYTIRTTPAAYGPYFHIMKKINKGYDKVYQFIPGIDNKLVLIKNYAQQTKFNHNEW
jgi:hypothetical protein